MSLRRCGKDMISSLDAYEVMNLYRCSATMLLGFSGLRSLIELQGFSPNGLVCANEIQRVLDGFLPRFGGVRFLLA